MWTKFWWGIKLIWMKANGYGNYIFCTCIWSFKLYTCSISFVKAVPTSKGQALADEYGIKFFETVSENHD
jgi:hypothetical protein